MNQDRKVRIHDVPSILKHIISGTDDNVEKVNIIIMEIKFLYNEVINFFQDTRNQINKINCFLVIHIKSVNKKIKTQH